MSDMNSDSQAQGHFDMGGPSGNHGMGMGFARTLGDMKFVGVTAMVYGVINCLSLAGAIMGIPIIIAANRFLEAVKILEEYRRTGRQEDLATGFHELGRSFRLLKIVVLITIAMTILTFVVMFLFGGIALLAGLAEAQ